MVLIAGHGRSGTTYMAKVLNACGIDVGHEKVGSEGAVSFLHIASGPYKGKIIEPFKYDALIHQVRHPLHVIASSMTLGVSMPFMERVVGRYKASGKLGAVMYTWYSWNRLIETRGKLMDRGSYSRFRIEDIDTVFPLILAFFGRSSVPLPNIPRNVNTRPHVRLGWKDLYKADMALALVIEEMANRYGYKTGGEYGSFKAKSIDGKNA